MGNRGRPKHPDILTPREWEVLALLREDRSNEEIADALGVTLATARFHLSEILGKLGVSSRHEAAAWQPDRERAKHRLWALTPIVALRDAKWNTLGISFGALFIVAALSLAAALAWGASRTGIAPAAFGDPRTICTPGPTYTPTPLGYRPAPPTWSPEGPAPAITAHSVAIQTRVAWTDAFFAADCDMRSYPDLVLRPATIDLWRRPQTLLAAIAEASWVITGRVTSAVFKAEPEPWLASSNVTVAIDATLKGGVRREAVIRQFGGPTYGYGGIVIYTDAGEQLLLPGDEVLLMFHQEWWSTSEEYVYVQDYPVGKYVIRDGIVHAVEGNPCNTIDGISVAEASRIISEFVQNGVADARLTAACDWSRFDPSYPTRTPTRAG